MPHMAVLLLLPDTAENLFACMGLADLLGLSHKATWLRRQKGSTYARTECCITVSVGISTVFWSNDSETPKL